MKKLLLFGIALSFFLPGGLVLAAFSDEPYFQYQGYFSEINYVSGSDTKAGAGVVVAVIDSGVWQEHPDLLGNIWINTNDIWGNGKDDDANGYVDDYYGWNFIDDNSDLSAQGTHATGVASIIAAKLNGNGMAGIASKAKIMSLAVCSDRGCDKEDVIEAIYYAVDNGAHIINLSLASVSAYGYTNEYDEAVQYAYDNDVVVIAAVGNGDVESARAIGQNLDYAPTSPACNDVEGYNIVLGVKTGEVWSNYGGCADISAPGKNILVATVPALEGGYGYVYSSGTSFSAPMVAAAAAVLKSEDKGLKNYEIIDRLISSSTDGKLNLNAALMYSKFPEITGVTSTLGYAGERIEVVGSHLVADWDIIFYNSDSIVTVDQESVIVHDAESLSFKIPANIKSGKYRIAIRNNKSKSSDFFEVINSRNTEEEGDYSEENSTNTGISTLGGQYDPLKKDSSLVERLKGRILLQTEEHGEAWYVNPNDSLRYYMANGDVAYEMMRSFSLGISNVDLEKIAAVGSSTEMLKTSSTCSTNALANRLKGHILLQVEKHGEAWYVHPETCRRIYMKNGEEAYNIMRYLSLGIANSDLEKMPSGSIE